MSMLQFFCFLLCFGCIKMLQLSDETDCILKLTNESFMYQLMQHRKPHHTSSLWTVWCLFKDQKLERRHSWAKHSTFSLSLSSWKDTADQVCLTPDISQEYLLVHTLELGKEVIEGEASKHQLKVGMEHQQTSTRLQSFCPWKAKEAHLCFGSRELYGGLPEDCFHHPTPQWISACIKIQLSFSSTACHWVPSALPTVAVCCFPPYMGSAAGMHIGGRSPCTSIARFFPLAWSVKPSADSSHSQARLPKPWC